MKNCDKTIFGVISFQAGGTLTTQDSLDIGQANIPTFPQGTENTVGLGYWKKIKKHKYKFFYTKVVSVKGSNPSPFPTVPKYRVRVEGDITLEQDNVCFNACAKLTRWTLCDVACDTTPFSATGPIIGPGPESVKFTGKKLDFCK